MAIPIGTTSRQLGAVARWMLAGVIVLGMLTWWRPSFHAWGALAGGLLLVWTLWLLWKTALGDRTVCGQPVYLALLGPVAVLAYHVARTGIGKSAGTPMGPSGALNVSMVYHLGLLALGVMLTHSLLSAAAGLTGLLLICGAAMTGGTAAAMAWAQPAETHGALALLAFAGIAVWLSALSAGSDSQKDGPGPPRRRQLALLCIAVAGVAAAVLAVKAPREALLAAAVTAGSVILGGRTLGRRFGFLLAAGAAVIAVILSAALLAGPLAAGMARVEAPILGVGEQAFATVGAGDSGLLVLVASIGWVGLLWLVGGLLACAIWLNARPAGGPRGGQARAIAWTAATGLCTCALLAPGGLVIPSVSLAVAFTWGLMPAMLARESRRRPAIVLAVPVVAMMLLLGIARREGLPLWSAGAFGAGEEFLHAGTGFLLAMLLAWVLGSRNGWLGLLGIVLAAMAGGAGEVLQQLVSRRNFEVRDWLIHGLGCAAAVVPYLLCIGSRWCESADARPKEILSGDPYGRP